jgi:ABC-type multidrug transport system fused ATPase/permease subunit
MGYTMWSLRAILFTLGTVIAFGLAAYFYKNGSMTIGTAYLIFNYTQRLLGPVNQISGQLSDFQRAAAGLSRVQQLLNTHPAIEEAPGKPLPIGALSVDVEHVSFGYRADEPVLHDTSFHLAPQTVLGILGRTGSGKTTLTRLLFRFYDPDCGVLRLGGVDLRAARLGDVRTRVAMVTQEVQLFHATVRDNLTFFDPTVSDTTLLEALEELGLREWYAELPDGLDTKLAVGGSGLSAGQAQLLALARVFLTDPGLVILDEASSRLDLATEALLDRAIARLLRNRTGIIIAHRLTTVRRADEIMILEDGRISEYGPRAQLAADPTSRFCHLLRTGLTEAAQ